MYVLSSFSTPKHLGPKSQEAAGSSLDIYLMEQYSCTCNPGIRTYITLELFRNANSQTLLQPC